MRRSSSSKQLSDIESLIAQGADALIVLAQDNEAILPGDRQGGGRRASRWSATTA